jgi:hypothetical protein
MFRLLLVTICCLLSCTALAAVQIERVARFEFRDGSKLSFINSPEFDEWAIPSSFRMSDDAQRFLLPILNEDGTGQYRPSRALFDRNKGGQVPILVPTQSGESLPPLQIDAMSGNGKFVVGRNQDGNLFRWSDATGPELLRGGSGWASGKAVAISNDGSRIVGNEISKSSTGFTKGFEWTASSNLVQAFTLTRTLPDGSTAIGQPGIDMMSDDGSTLLLSGDLGLPGNLYSTVFESLIAPDLWYILGPPYILPTLMSSDGSILAYFSSASLSNRVKIGDEWRSVDTTSAFPTAMSPDGKVIGLTQSYLALGSFFTIFPLLIHGDSRIILEDGSVFTDLDRYLSLNKFNGLQTAVYDIADDNRTLLTAIGSVGLQNGTLVATLEIVTVTIPEVPGGVMVGMGLMGAVIIARWRRAANRSR